MTDSNTKKSEPKRAVLTITDKDGDTQSVKLNNDATIIGRAKGDIIIDDKEISSTHCQIQNIKGEYHLFDMNSTNGTFLNNERIVKAKLKEDDIITVGQTIIVFKIRDEAQTKTISTVFQVAKKQSHQTGKVSVVDTLIESAAFANNLPEIKLEVTYGDGSSDTLLFNQEVVFIGRASSFGRFDGDHEISRKHLMIKINNQKEIFVEDQGSTNGVKLNGQKIEGIHKISPKDLVEIGSCKLYISLI
jgi:pSer/pThr/pTyr-binding forkhead associated (FHA) protein